MPTPSVSFVCTFYNKAAYVELVLNSIKNQVYAGAAEYIFVDDGSTDDTLKLLQHFTRDWDNCHVISKENGGQTSATIVGLQATTHDYIKTWDGDDYAHPDLTRLLIEACEEHRASFAYCHVDGGPDIAPSERAYLEKWLLDLPAPQPAVLQTHYLHTVLHSPITNPTGSLLRRSLLDQTGLPDPRVVIPDVYMTYAAALVTDFAYIPSTLAFAFPHVPNRLTSNEAQIMHDLNAALACFYDNFYAQLPHKTKLYVGRRAASRARNWAKRRYNQSIFGRFGRLFLRSRLIWPMLRHDVFATCLAFRQGDARIRLSPQMKERHD